MAFPSNHSFKRMKKIQVIEFAQKQDKYIDNLRGELCVALAERDQADMAFTELQDNNKSFEEVCSHGLAISKENQKLRKELQILNDKYHKLDLVNQNLETKYLNGQWTKDIEDKLGEKCELISQMKQILSL